MFFYRPSRFLSEQNQSSKNQDLFAEETRSLSSQQSRAARRFCVQFVYGMELVEHSSFRETDFLIFCEQNGVSSEIRPFVTALSRRVLETMSELDALIEKYTHNWKLSRIAKVDLSLLRVCACELRDRRSVAKEIIIADAAEIGKEYGSGGSSAFVNGVLDGIAKVVRGN